MARTEIWIVDDANPAGAWYWIGGYEGPGVTVPVYAVAVGVSATAGEAVATIAGKVTATASGTSSTTGTAVASTTSLGQYLALNGLADSYASVPDEAAFDFAGSHTIRVRMRMPDWTPTTSLVLGKWPWSGGNKSYQWKILPDGKGYFEWTNNGSTGAGVSTAAALSGPPAADTIAWFQFVLDSSNRQITVSTHADQIAEPTTGWSQIGQSVAGAATGTIYAGTALLTIGGYVSGVATGMVGDVFQLVLRNSSDTKVFQLDPDNWTTGSTWVCSTGQTVTLASANATIGSA